MLKANNEYSDEEKSLMVLRGCDYATYEANIDIKNFNKYLSGDVDGFSLRTMRDMKVLEILKALGYPMDELGTYLYKDLISEICEVIKDVSTRRDMVKCRDLLARLNDAYSSFYHLIGREWKELGIRSFHLYVLCALEQIDYDSIDEELSSKINGNDLYDLNYGLNAFKIAAYVLNKYSFDNEEYKKPIIKKLDNSPELYV